MEKMKRANRSQGKKFYDPTQRESPIKCQSPEEVDRKPGTKSSFLGPQRLSKSSVPISNETWAFPSLVPNMSL